MFDLTLQSANYVSANSQTKRRLLVLGSKGVELNSEYACSFQKIQKSQVILRRRRVKMHFLKKLGI